MERSISTPARGDQEPTPPEENALGLSDWFDPFLPQFTLETLRSGGEVRTVHQDNRIVGLLLSDPVEKLSSVFTRQRPVAQELLRGRRDAVYSELDLGVKSEPFEIYWTSLEGTRTPRRFRHPVHLASEGENPEVMGLVREVFGALNERWFGQRVGSSEHCFVVRVEGALVGAAWASVAGTRARFHSLAVRPGYRGLGIGGDLLAARILWAQRAGARDALSEIAERNIASRVISERAGMQSVGRIFLYRESRPWAS